MSIQTQLLYRIFEPLMIYAALKYATNRFWESRFFQALTILLMIVFILPLWIIALVVLKLYKLFVGLLLFGRHGKKFVGFIHGSDLIFALLPNSRNATINVVFMVKYEGSGEDFFKSLSERLYETIMNDLKCRSVRKSFMGYSYYLETKIRKESIIKELVTDEEDFLKYMDVLDKEDLPSGFMYVFYIAKRRMKNSSGTWSYPVFGKIHHSLGDGLSCLSHFKTLSPTAASEKIALTVPKTSRLDYLKSFWTCVKSAEIYSAKLLKLRHQEFERQQDGDKHYVVWMDPNKDLLDKIKQIRKLLNDGTTTTAIICAALSNGLNEYFVKSNTKRPEFLTISLAVLLNVSRCNYSNFTNSFVPLEIKVPIAGRTMDKLKTIKNDLTKLHNILDIKLGSWCTKVPLSLFPNPLCHKIATRSIQSITLSNLPGFQDNINLGDNMTLDSYLYWNANFYDCGICISTYSYANRFNFGMTIDKTVVPSYEDAKRICDSTIENIYAIFDECSNAK